MDTNTKRTELRDYSSEDYIKFFGRDSVKLLQTLNVANFMAYDLAKKQVVNEFKDKDIEKIYKELGLKNKDRAIKIGYIVKKHYGDILKDKRKDNIICEVWLTESDIRTNMQVAGTTGSGKTVWLKAVLEQQMARGGGAFVVFGKADNKMLQQLQYAAAKYNREQDLFIIDWTATADDLKTAKDKYNKNVITNSINFFELGDEDAVISTFFKNCWNKRKGQLGSSSKEFVGRAFEIFIQIRTYRFNI